MKRFMTILMFLMCFTSQAQLIQKDTTPFDTSTYQRQYGYNTEYDYLKDSYEYQKNQLIWHLVGGTVFGLGNVMSYYRHGNTDYLLIGGGMSLTFNLYTVTKLIQTKRKIKELER